MVRLISRRQCVELTVFIASFQLMLTLLTGYIHYTPSDEGPGKVIIEMEKESLMEQQLSFEVSKSDATSSSSSTSSSMLSSEVEEEQKLSTPSSILDDDLDELIADVISPLALLPLDEDVQVDALATTFHASLGHMDKSRLFRTRMFAISGHNWANLSEHRSVCMGAQSSLDRLHWVLESTRNWSGGMSIALFTPDIEYHLALIFIKFLRMCFPQVREQVSFHFTYPNAHPPAWMDNETLLKDWPTSVNCQEPRLFLKFLVGLRSEQVMKWRESFAYPQNLLRNQAKSGCQSEFTFIPDIDMIPMPQLDLQLEQFLQTKEAKECKLCAFVVPTYEISSDLSSLPTTKEQLLQLIGEKKARQFHVVVYKPNQGASQLGDRWEKVNMTDEMQLAYKIDKYQFRYEPLYVSRAADTPDFDERFVGFGMTRNTQTYEMYVKGFEFWLLSNAFTSHWGFQTTKTRPKWRAKQQEANNKKFDVFATELYARYGRDPYNMMSKLKKLDMKNIKVAYGNQ